MKRIINLHLTDKQIEAAHRTMNAMLLADGKNNFHDLWQIATCLERLEYLARIVRRRYEHACNYEQTPAQERRVDRITSEIDGIAATLAEHARSKFTIEHNRDPRGSSVKLHMHVPSNDMYRTIYFG